MKEQKRFNGQVLGLIYLCLIKGVKGQRSNMEKTVIVGYVTSLKETIENVIDDQFTPEDISVAIKELEEMRLIAIGQTPKGKELIMITKQGKELEENRDELKKVFG